MKSWEREAEGKMQYMDDVEGRNYGRETIRLKTREVVNKPGGVFAPATPLNLNAKSFLRLTGGFVHSG